MRMMLLVTLLTVGFVTGCAPRVVRAPLSLPSATQLELARIPKVWVAGFVVTARDNVDLNTETVRLLRAGLRSVTSVPVVDAEAVPIRNEQTFSDQPYWRRLAEEHGVPLIVTGSVQLLVAPAQMVQRGRRTTFVHASGRVLRATVVVIDGQTGAVMSTQKLPERVRYGVGRFSSGTSLYYDLMDRALSDWIQAIAAGSRQQSGAETPEVSRERS